MAGFKHWGWVTPNPDAGGLRTPLMRTSRPPPTTTRGSGIGAALAGALAAVAGVATGHLVATLLDPASSPVLAVAATVIDLTPTPVKEWAIRNFGTADKPILLGSVLVGTLLLAAVAGLLARRRPLLGAGLLVLLVLAAGVAALTRPSVTPVAVIPSLVTVLVGVGVLLFLIARMLGTVDTSGALSGSAFAATGSSRRGFLISALAVAGIAAAAGAAGQLVLRARTRIGDIRLPPPRTPLPALPTGLEQKYPGITALATPNSDFYRVDTALTVPSVDLDSWTLTIDGDVERQVELTFDDIRRMDLVEHDITLTCVSNEVGGRYVGAARWLGVPLGALLDRAGVGDRADQILSTAVDGFTISTPLSVALDGRSSMLAIGMNGEALPAEHGFPARLVTPGIYGYVGATKWVERLTLTTYAKQESYWTRRKWATDAPIKLSSRVDTPRPLSTIEPGRTVLGGVAWAQPVGVGKVEVRVDDGPWQPARLGPDVGEEYWRQWYLPWEAESGSHTVLVRATDLAGKRQTARRATPFPDGSSGVQSVVITVS